MENILQQLLVDTAHAARSRFSKKPIRVWYVMLGEKSWKALIINTANKMKLAEGPIKESAKASLLSLKNQLEAAARKTS